MSDVVIRVEGLGKHYRIGGSKKARYGTLREALTGWFRRQSPLPGDENEREFWALKDVGFEVKRGEAVGIIGRNGAGKSTLLKILSRVTEPTEGEIDLCGRLGSLLEVGAGFHPELTGRENVFLNGAILGMSRSEMIRKFDAIVSFAEVDRFIDTPVKYYSSGMYTRLAFAVAAHIDVEILIVDEVLAVGDSTFQKKCMGKMGEMAGDGRTVLFVSHSMAAIHQLCQTGILLRQGRLSCKGPIDEVTSQYLMDATTSLDGIFDLTTHAARPAGYHPVIRSLVLRGEQGQPTSQFQPRDRLTVDLHLHLESPLKGARAAVAIEDSHGRRITTFASYFNTEELPPLMGNAVLRCQSDPLPLGEGRYLVSASIGTRSQGLMDSVDAAGWFNIEWNNAYGNGESYHPLYGPIVTNSKWQSLGPGDVDTTAFPTTSDAR